MQIMKTLGARPIYSQALCKKTPQSIEQRDPHDAFIVRANRRREQYNPKFGASLQEEILIRTIRSSREPLVILQHLSQYVTAMRASADTLLLQENKVVAAAEDHLVSLLLYIHKGHPLLKDIESSIPKIFQDPSYQLSEELIRAKNRPNFSLHENTHLNKIRQNIETLGLDGTLQELDMPFSRFGNSASQQQLAATPKYKIAEDHLVSLIDGIDHRDAHVKILDELIARQRKANTDRYTPTHRVRFAFYRLARRLYDPPISENFQAEIRKMRDIIAPLKTEKISSAHPDYSKVWSTEQYKAQKAIISDYIRKELDHDNCRAFADWVSFLPDPHSLDNDLQSRLNPLINDNDFMNAYGEAWAKPHLTQAHPGIQTTFTQGSYIAPPVSKKFQTAIDKMLNIIAALKRSPAHPDYSEVWSKKSYKMQRKAILECIQEEVHAGNCEPVKAWLLSLPNPASTAKEIETQLIFTLTRDGEFQKACKEASARQAPEIQALLAHGPIVIKPNALTNYDHLALQNLQNKYYPIFTINTLGEYYRALRDRGLNDTTIYQYPIINALLQDLAPKLEQHTYQHNYLKQIEAIRNEGIDPDTLPQYIWDILIKRSSKIYREPG